MQSSDWLPILAFCNTHGHNGAKTDEGEARKARQGQISALRIEADFRFAQILPVRRSPGCITLRNSAMVEEGRMPVHSPVDEQNQLPSEALPAGMNVAIL